MQLNTEITINATPETIWSILMDFDAYAEWNPFIQQIKGRAAVGEQLQIELHQTKGKPMSIAPKVMKVQPNQHFSWKGKLLFSGVFDGTHSFTLEPNTDGTTRFRHEEQFGGILVPAFRKMLKTTTLESFQLMNNALKERSEAHS